MRCRVASEPKQPSPGLGLPEDSRFRQTSVLCDESVLPGLESVQGRQHDFVKLQLRVAVITHAESHPNADRLLKLTLDAGEAEPRTVCAGIAEAYQPDELIGRRVTLLANLKPRKIRGIVSQGMLLAAGEGAGVRLVEVPEGPEPGSSVS